MSFRFTDGRPKCFDGDSHVFQVHRRQAEMFSERPEKAILGDQIEAQQGIPQASAELVEANQRLQQLHPGDGLLVKE
jgi:hypothetical protein